MTTRTRFRVLATLVATVAMMGAVVGSAFAQYPVDAFIECENMEPGETATCVAGGLDPNTTYDVTATLIRTASGAQAAGFTLATTAVLAQDPPAETLFDEDVTTDGDGEMTFSFAIPEDAEEGDRVVVEIDGMVAAFVVDEEEGPVTVQPTPTPRAADRLPRTGFEIGVWIAIGAAAVVVGGGALATTRRRGRASA